MKSKDVVFLVWQELNGNRKLLSVKTTRDKAVLAKAKFEESDARAHAGWAQYDYPIERREVE